MYTPALFVENRVDVLYEFIRQNPFATLVTNGPNGPEASHVPVVLHADAEAAPLLRCHLARANEQWKSIQSGSGALVIFQGADHYITPSWYPSKQEHGRVVPTWNYVAVHVRGRATIFDASADLLRHLQSLTTQQERAFADPWSVEDAPKDYVEALSKAIVGIEIAVDDIQGKAKLSQNRPSADRLGVIEGLRSLHTPESLAMAQLVSLRNAK